MELMDSDDAIFLQISLDFGQGKCQKDHILCVCPHIQMHDHKNLKTHCQPLDVELQTI